MSDKIAAVTADDRSLAEHHVILQSMVTSKQQELSSLNQLVLNAQTLLNRAKDDHQEELRSHARKLQIAASEHEASLEGQRYALKQREKELDDASHNLDIRKQEIDALALEVEPVKSAKEELIRERIAVEQLRQRAGELEQQAGQLQQVYTQRMTELMVKENEVTRLHHDVTVHAQEVEAASQAFEKTKMQTVIDLENLTKLRTELDPKLKALAEQESSVQEKVARAEALHAEAFQKAAENQQIHADLQGLSARLEARQQVLLNHQTALKQFEQELGLRVKQAESKGVTGLSVPTLPEPSPT